MINKIQHRSNRSGIALLVMVIIVATVSVLSFGFIMKADSELSCGDNTIFRTEMDYIGQSALNYAKALIVNPQDAATGADGYWHGDMALQLEKGSDDYFDVQVERSETGETPECTFNVTCQGYKLSGESRVSETKLAAQLRLDPCIALWVGATSTIHANVTVYGDTYCNGDLSNDGQIYGDVFSDGFSGSNTGQSMARADRNVTWPGISASDFEHVYYIDGTPYSPVVLNNSSYTDVDWGATESNPAGIYYRNGGLDLHGNNKINGTLIVTGDHLDFEDGQSTITSFKNYPAIVVESELHFKEGEAVITGLVQAYSATVNKDYGDITIVGGLFIRDGGFYVEDDYEDNIIVRGDPMAASIKLMPTAVDIKEWSPVGGAYYKSIRRDD
ncbi:MAG: hypothetical protein FVQ82_09290 [Planctomycetes bacterium]|nr:hypothetical protein [Planctomycetota bacterium]